MTVRDIHNNHVLCFFMEQYELCLFCVVIVLVWFCKYDMFLHHVTRDCLPWVSDMTRRMASCFDNQMVSTCCVIDVTA